MYDAERQSPRAAIRRWLQVTDNKSTAKPADALFWQQNFEGASRHRPRRHHRTRHASEPEDEHDEEASREHRRHSKSGSRQKHVTDDALFLNPGQAQPQQYSKENAAVSPDGLGLAERLGLHAPFRTFRDHSDNSIPGVQSRPRKRKRRRSRSSTSSYLEPAAANDLSDKDHDRSNHATTLPTITRSNINNRGKNISPTPSQGSEIMLPSPKKLLKSYERRPRHKTRPDRYELKQNGRQSRETEQDAKKDREKKKRKKHQRKEKSGAALMHDFAAQNVAHDRLTLKPAKTLGLFGKGRASSPVRRRGLPDLAFNEMTFLTSRRDKRKDSCEDSSNKPPDKKKLRKSTKAADTEAEFSRYFMSAKPTSGDATTSRRQQCLQEERRSRDRESSQPFVDLPERPFLGFGSCGPNTSMSPAKSPIDRVSKSIRRVSGAPTPSTSYLTWSESRGPSHDSPPRDRRQYVEPLKTSALSNRKRKSPARRKRLHTTPPASPPCVQKKSSKAQGAVSRPPSRSGNGNAAPGQNSESQLIISERPRSREKSQKCSDTGSIELDAAKITQDIEGSIPDVTHRTEAATHDRPELAPSNLDQAVRQSSGQGPQCKPPANDLRPASAQIQVISPHSDSLDDILDALLRDCNANVTETNTASCAALSHCNSHVGERNKMPGRIQEDSHMPAHAFVNRVHPPEPPASALNLSKKSCSASLQLAPSIDDSPYTHTLSRGSLNASNRLSLGYTRSYPPSPMQNQMRSKNVRNGNDSFYEKQQEQADVITETSTGHIPPNEAVQDDLLGPKGGSDHGDGPDEQVPGRHSVELRDGPDDYRPNLNKSLQEGYEDYNHHKVGHGQWFNQDVDREASCDSGASIHDVCRGGFDDEIMAINHANDYQEKVQSFARRGNEHKIEPQAFTTNVSDAYPLWRPRHLFSSKYGLEACPADTWVQDVDPSMSAFWTANKLY